MMMMMMNYSRRSQISEQKVLKTIFIQIKKIPLRFPNKILQKINNDESFTVSCFETLRISWY